MPRKTTLYFASCVFVHGIFFFIHIPHYFSACEHTPCHSLVTCCIRRPRHHCTYRAAKHMRLLSAGKCTTNTRKSCVYPRTTEIASQLFVDSCHMVFNVSNRQLLRCSMEASCINCITNIYAFNLTECRIRTAAH